VIAWWGVGSLRSAARDGWSTDARAFVVMVVALLACGVLSFDYSRDRLGGMALVFYAVTAFYALRAAATGISRTLSIRFLPAVLALTVLSCAWQIRAFGTVEWARH